MAQHAGESGLLVAPQRVSPASTRTDAGPPGAGLLCHSRAEERAWAAAMSPRGEDARALGLTLRSAGATVGARQRLRPRRGNTQVTRGVRRDQPAARRAASAAARQAGRARARPTAAADGAVTRGRRTAIVALPHSTFWLLSRSIQEIVRQIFTPHTTTLSVQFFLRLQLLFQAPATVTLQQLFVRGPWSLVHLALPRSHACPHTRILHLFAAHALSRGTEVFFPSLIPLPTTRLALEPSSTPLLPFARTHRPNAKPA